MTRLELSGFVVADLDAIASFIAQDNPARAVTFIRDIRQKFRSIQQHPLLYRLRVEIGGDARMASVGNYAILFRANGDVVRIERVVYGGCDLPAIIGSEA